MKFQDQIEFAYEPSIMFTIDETFLFGREPTLRRMPDGSLISLIYTGGPGEPNPDNVVAVIRSEDDGASWSYPEVVFGCRERASWGTEIFTECERPFMAFHTYNYNTFYSELRPFFSFTDDSGKTWSEPVNVPGIPPSCCIRQGKVLSDGSWVFPVYWMEITKGWNRFGGNIWDGRLFRSGVIRSVNSGQSYSLHGYQCAESFQAWEPEITELEPGHLRMYIRSGGGGVLWECDSYDFGVTWTLARKGEIPNPDTKVVIYKVHDAHVMVNNICNDRSPDRNTLEIWVSKDNCETWGKKIKLAGLKEGSELRQVAYPHGFADDKAEKLYLAIDAIKEFYLVKIPYGDLL